MAPSTFTELLQLIKLKSPSLSAETQRDTFNGNPDLPTELILTIFHLAIASSSSSSSVTRQSLLSTLSLLCRSSHVWAVPLLYTSPSLSSPTQLALFTRTIKRSPALAKQVEALQLDGLSRGGDGDIAGYRRKMTHKLPGIMKRCRKLKEVVLESCVVFDLRDFRGAEVLTHLTLKNTLISPRSNNLPSHSLLPNLTSLTLHSAQFSPPFAPYFLSTHTLPSLTSLSLNGCTLISDPYTLRKLGPFEWSEQGARRLLGGLEELRIGNEGAGLGEREGWRVEREVVRYCTEARSVVLPKGMDGLALDSE